MIAATAFRGSVVKEIPAQGAREFLKGGGLVWVDVLDATEDELSVIGAEFDLHELALEDARHRNQRTKIERYGDHAFLVLYAPDPDPRDLPEVHLFTGAGWVVTLRFVNKEGRAFELDPVREYFERWRGTSCSVGALIYSILDVVVDGYFAVADALDDALEHIEDTLFVGLDPATPSTREDDAELQRHLLEQRRSLVLVRRKVVPLRDVVLSLLRREYPWVNDGIEPYLQDVFDHLLRVVDQIDAQRELVGNAVDAYVAMISNRANEIMKKMTSWGAILLGSTLIAGIYGMNFEHMPELGNRFGYPGALMAMAGLTVGLFLYFRRKRWL